MKNKILLSIVILPLLLLVSGIQYSCSTSGQATTTKPKAERVYLTLLDRLREEPGLTISGTGNSAIIRIRGNTSISSNNEPLYVVNGSPVTSGFASVSASIDVNNIESIRVLPRSQSGLYGSRGGNGVIVIKTK